MTCIVTYKKSGKVFMGADSNGTNGYNVFSRKDDKIFEKNRMVFGFTSSYRMGQLLKWKLDIPKHPVKMGVDSYINTLFLDAVIECLESGGYSTIEGNRKSSGVFLVGYRGRVFNIGDDFSIAESADKFEAIGSGAEVAKGSMSALLKYSKGISPQKLLTLALKSASEHVESVGGRIVLKVLE